MVRDMIANPNMQKAATKYRKHAYQIGGMVVTPIFIAGQLMAHVNTNAASRRRGFRQTDAVGVSMWFSAPMTSGPLVRQPAPRTDFASTATPLP